MVNNTVRELSSTLKSKATNNLLTNNPLPTVPPPVVMFVIVNGKAFKMRGEFHDKWAIYLCRTTFNKTDFEDSE
jgi:hypothetical protein